MGKSFANTNFPNFQNLALNTQKFIAIQYPNVTGAWVAITYYKKWEEYTKENFFRAYAVFAALEFLKRFQPKKKPIVVTFGQPRMGNDIFAAYAQNKLEIYRVTLADDWLPNLPIRGIKKFSKWNDEIERLHKSHILAYVEYSHFKPEFWIDLNPKEFLNCECHQDDYPIVYKCFNIASFKEHPNKEERKRKKKEERRRKKKKEERRKKKKEEERRRRNISKF
ncbi:hypothetical protein G9A89_017623 [Geosiphon pyriformis]|nr:hypothetical protein G9A89_017623 [Geosiphon pyriformis]